MIGVVALMPKPTAKDEEDDLHEGFEVGLSELEASRILSSLKRKMSKLSKHMLDLHHLRQPLKLSKKYAQARIRLEAARR